MKLTLAVLLFLSTLSAQDKNEKNDMVTAHVSKSRMVLHNTLRYQDLEVLMNEKRYVLESIVSCGGVLATGDYKARLILDRHPRAYDSWQVYQFQFDDGRKREYVVIEQE